MGTGISQSQVNDLAIYNGKLIAAGGFYEAGGLPALNIAAWDGSSWSTLGIGTDDAILTLTVYNGLLIAAGEFTTAGGVEANRIAAWDGTSWSSLGSGMSGYIQALAEYDGKLVLGGQNSVIGNKVFAYLAEWTKGTCCQDWGDPGDANSDHYINLLDILYTIDYVYADPYGVPANPNDCNQLLDSNGDHNVNLLDILYTIDFIYSTPQGPAPVCPE